MLEKRIDETKKSLIKPKEELKSLPLPESELIKRAKNGNDEAFEMLISRYEKKIYNLAYRLLNNEEDAAEVLQETLIRAYRFLKKFQERSSFYTWLYRIAVNVALRKLKKRAKEEKVLSLDQNVTGYEDIPQEIPDETQNPEVIYERKKIQEAVRKALAEIPENYRSVIFLRDVEGLSNKEVAEILKLSVAAVKSRLHRGRLFLKEKLKHLIN
ncbi:MAG: sigma-70 family RNA polymerase sigma factor [candidate division WOR-3 bacterium]|nr:sigma-70 family RNA polymerase sigma factor [candidate division WOR-3 bacterium]MCX7837389.1 sigma-70 family RNA polymerase sigma factor [candidate division WOR-3 bacterium]MDW8114314.1 sigma-70 family RNA polymerase sigma factor [candidate division WOR-3 bacterium]